MTSFLQKSIEDGSLVLWHSYRSWNGTFDDLSGNGNDGTASNVEFRGGGVQVRDPDGYIVVADSDELQLTTGSFIILGFFPRVERANDDTSARLISKRDAGGTNWEIILDSTPDIGFYDGVNTRTLSVDYYNAKFIGVTIDTGPATAIGYLDGVNAGNFDDTSTLSIDDAPLYIGNWYNASRSTYNVIQSVLIFNKVLTETEISKLYGELMRIQRW